MKVYVVYGVLEERDTGMIMVEKSFKTDCDNEFEQLKKIYKCMTCKYFKVERLSLGLLWQECEYDKIQKSKFKRWCRLEPRQDGAFKMKTACDNYEVKNEETQ